VQIICQTRLTTAQSEVLTAVFLAWRIEGCSVSIFRIRQSKNSHGGRSDL